MPVTVAHTVQTKKIHPELAQNSAIDTWARVVPFALVFLAGSAILFGELGLYPLFNPDEALYAEPAREMLEIGDYITTYLNYVVRFTKPPLAIWGQAACILAFGCNEFAVRFFGAACGALLLAISYCFADKFVGRRAALVTGISLITAPLFIGTAREAITDMPLSLFMAGAMFAYFAAFRLKNVALLCLAHIGTGLAVMTKGPVGLVLPVAILVVYHFLRSNLGEALKFYRPLLGTGIISLIAVPWFAVEIYITKGAYFNEFILRENFQRFTSVVDSHKGGWWYHIAAMMGGFFPWSVFLPQALIASIPWAKLKDAWKNSGPFSILQPFQNLKDSDDLALYALCWTVVTVAFFSASVSKLLPYTLPAFPAIAVLLALEFERIIENNYVKRAVYPVFILACVFIAATILPPMFVSKLRDAPEVLVEIIQSLASFELIFVVASMALLSRRFYRSAFLLFAIPTFLGFLFFGHRLLDVLSKTWEEPLPAMARYAAVSDLPILVYDMRKPSMPFYTGRRVEQPSNPDQLVAMLAESKGAYILSKIKKKQFFRDLKGCRIQHAEGRFILVRYTPPEKAPSNDNNQLKLNLPKQNSLVTSKLQNIDNRGSVVD